MCPVCMATAAMIAGSAGSGGLAALTVGLFRRKTLASKISKLANAGPASAGLANAKPANARPANAEEVQYGDEHNRSGSSESGITG
jgi:hypothetical protein